VYARLNRLLSEKKYDQMIIFTGFLENLSICIYGSKEKFCKGIFLFLHVIPSQRRSHYENMDVNKYSFILNKIYEKE